MQQDRFHTLATLFEQARVLEPEAREAYLDRACGGDAVLRARVRALLEGHERAGVLDAPLPLGDPQPSQAPERIGRFRVLGRLGGGGMGVVYRAEQDQPRRLVAIKVMHAGLAGDDLRRRFELETRVLARLQHPGIAHIYEAGTFEQCGEPRPFFAMELVDGAPLDRFANEACLSIAGRLRLFVAVCEAVEHAHQKGVIHRDLKPANILVTAGGAPKILDFGVARATDADLHVTLSTSPGQLVGTLAYMSPEQVGAGEHVLDTRSDVYALGVILYELLSGALPYDVGTATIANAVRVIEETEPQPLGAINRSLRGDLETIALKALRKRPEDRYQSASDLAADVRRFLAHEPIVARPASSLYYLRKFARRHRGVVAGSAVALAALVAGLIGTSLAMIDAARERDRALAASRAADQARVAEARQRRAAEASAGEARREAVRANTVASLLEQMLASADPALVEGRAYTVRELLDDFAANLPHLLGDQRVVEADVRSTIGKAYLGLAEFERARPHLVAAEALRRAELGESHPRLAVSLRDLARLSFYEGDFAQAESLARQALVVQQQGEPDSRGERAASQHLLARVRQQQGDYAEAEALLREALEARRARFGPQHPDVARSLHELALLLDHRGRAAEAEPLYRRALEMHRALGLDESADHARALFDLAASLHRQGSTPEVEALYQESVALTRKLYGDEHPALAGGLLGLANLLKGQGDLAGCEKANREALAIFRRVHGDEHPSVALTTNNLANVVKEQGDLEQAEQLHRQALAVRRQIYGEAHPAVVNSLGNLAALLKAAGAFDEAESHYRQALAAADEALDSRHPTVGFLQLGLADLYVVQRRYDEAEGVFRRSLGLLEAALPAGHPGLGDARTRLGECLTGLGRHAEAERELLAGYAYMTAALGADSNGAQRAAASLAALYETTGDAAEAGAWREKASDPDGGSR